MHFIYTILQKKATRNGLFIFFLLISFHLTQGQTTEGAWHVKSFSGSDPEQRHESAFASVGDKFYLIGGRGTKTIQVYDPTTNQWSNTNTTTKDIHHFQAVTYEGKIYIIGALTGRFPDEDPVSNILIYDPDADKLITGASIPEDRQRGSSGVVVYNGKFYLISGNRNGHKAFLDDGTTPANVKWFDEYDPVTDSWKELPDAPHARDHFAAAVIGDKLYVAAGRRSKQGTPDGTFKDTEAAVDVYDFTTGKWLSGSDIPDDIPTQRAGAAATVLQGELIVMGGEVDSNPPDDLALATTEALNPANGTWRELASMNLGRHASQAVVYNDSIYLPAGSKTKGATEIMASENFLEVFAFDTTPQDEPEDEIEPDSSKWTSVSNSLKVRTESPCVLYQGEIYFFNGFSSSINIEPTCEKYNPSTDEWTQLASMPSQADEQSWAVTHNGIALVGDTVWIVGGRIGDHPGPVTNQVWWYKISTDTWMSGPELPMPVGGGGLGRLGRKLHYVGGFDSDAMCDVDYHLVYDLDDPAAGWQDLTATSPMPEPRNHFGTVVLGGKLYTIAGQHGHDGCEEGEDVASVHVYDPFTEKWTQLADFPHNESHIEPSTFALDGKIYVIGGEIEGDKVHAYDPATDQWTELTEFLLPERLMAPGARILGDTLVVATGGAPDVHNPTNKTRILTFSRTPNQTLGFNPSELTINLNGDTTKTADVILYSHAGETPYGIDESNLPAWLSVSKTSGEAQESSEEITLTVDASVIMEAGTYHYQLIATAPDYTEAMINITLQVTKQEDPSEEEPPLAVDSAQMAPDASRQHFILYPNPTQDQTVVSGDFLRRNQPFQVEVFDELGKICKTYQWNHSQSGSSQSGSLQSSNSLTGSRYIISTDDLPVGIYIIQVTQGKVRHRQRLVKN